MKVAGDPDGSTDTHGDGADMDVVHDTGPDTHGDPATDPGHDTGPDATDVAPDTTPGCGAGCPPNAFCEQPAGVCEPGSLDGTCVDIPTGGCPEYYAPECGCDGVTYGNQCERRQASVSMLHSGECGSGASCAPWLEECAPGEMCDAPEDSCWVDGVMGTCRVIRDDCGFLWDPQCGCDAITYANECERMASGVWLDHWGECGPPCGGADDPPCVESAFCEYPTGMCGPGLPGECVEVPIDCPDLWDPVCGCDGMTYSNDCDRQSSRAQLRHRGPC